MNQKGGWGVFSPPIARCINEDIINIRIILLKCSSSLSIGAAGIVFYNYFIHQMIHILSESIETGIETERNPE
jgi:hypothetical protein